MNQITEAQLRAIAPNVGTRAGIIVAALNAAMARFGINTPARIAAFIANVAHESGHFTKAREGLDYRAERLPQVWPSRFKTAEQAQRMAHNPELLANYVYANRMGNGDITSGDGYKYRGAGWLQLTGKDNQLACARHFGIAPGEIGEWLATPTGAALSAAWQWQRSGCNELADAGKFDAVCDVINIGHQTGKVGDAIGYGERLAMNNVANRVLA